MFWLALLTLFLISILLCGAYCRWAKADWRDHLHDAPVVSVDNANDGAIKFPVSHNGVTTRVKSWAISFADDYTFFLMKIMGYFPSHVVRMAFYREVLCMDIAPRCVIHYGMEVRSPWKVKMGRGCIIGDRAILDARSGIEFDDYVNLSTECWIWTLQHDVNSPAFGTEEQGLPVHVGTRSWLSNRTTILPGCDIAEGSVLAAGAVLTKAITQPFKIFAGGSCQAHCR